MTRHLLLINLEEILRNSGGRIIIPRIVARFSEYIAFDYMIAGVAYPGLDKNTPLPMTLDALIADQIKVLELFTALNSVFMCPDSGGKYCIHIEQRKQKLFGMRANC